MTNEDSSNGGPSQTMWERYRDSQKAPATAQSSWLGREVGFQRDWMLGSHYSREEIWAKEEVLVGKKTMSQACSVLSAVRHAEVSKSWKSK